LAAVLYIGGGFVVTFLVNVPMNEELARVGALVGPAALAQVRAEYEGPVELLERRAHRLLVAGVSRPHRRLSLAVGWRLALGSHPQR
jgi:hypothetical protein